MMAPKRGFMRIRFKLRKRIRGIQRKGTLKDVGDEESNF